MKSGWNAMRYAKAANANRTEKCCTKFHSPRIVMRASSIKNTRAAWLGIKLSNLILILIALMLG
jgi:hypothetical protein